MGRYSNQLSGEISPRDLMVNAWEFQWVHRRDSTVIRDESTLSAVVRHAWGFLGLEYPPHVEIVSPTHTVGTVALACASRTQLTLFGPQSTTVVLHELAHSATMSVEESTMWVAPMYPDPHGPEWLATFVHLLDGLMGSSFSKTFLMGTMPIEIRPGWALPRLSC